MKWSVFESGRPADHSGFPQVHPSWNNSTFSSEKEARDYANLWLYGAGLKGFADHIPLNEPIDFSGFGDTIEIREIP